MITNEFGKGLLFGNITGVLLQMWCILGAGTVGICQKTAIGLGATVKFR
jgi:alanine dehydrogenase